MVMDEEVFFVGIKDPVSLRRELLHSSKSVLDALKRYEDYAMLKEEKVNTILKLKRVFDELVVINRKLRGKLPRKELRFPVLLARELEEARAPSPPSQLELEPMPPVRKLAKREKTKLEQLEEELARVEERLRGLE